MDNYITQDKFLWSRLWMHIKREILSNIKQIRWQLALIVGVVLISEILICSNAYDNWKQNDAFYNSAFQDPAQVPILLAMIALGLFIVAIAASMTFSPLRTKAGKINQLMSVGTSAEKFWTRVLIYNVAPALFFLTSVCIIDLIRCLLVDSIMPIKAQFVIINPFIDETRVKAILLFCSFTACVSSFFTTVSVYSPKHTFLKGVCIIIALQTLGSWFLFKYGSILRPWEHHLDLAYWTALGVVTAIAVVLSVVSYIKYKETEL
ncbi:MAG: hypothetical protein K2K88_04945 [Muribaculaceae bacterium]|nr:hypothetical protein [Muribaculaceae bacterium]MDE6643006.1 hypothetical protein [Muribaculaceae bacterium]